MRVSRMYALGQCLDTMITIRDFSFSYGNNISAARGLNHEPA